MERGSEPAYTVKEEAMLTDTKIRAAKGREGAYKLADRDGLYLHVAPSGSKSWRFDYRLAGKRETLTIGRYPDVSLEQARHGVRKPGFISLADARSMLARGESPAAAKQERKAAQKIARANTLKAIAEQWYAARVAARSKSWCENARRWLDKDIYPEFGSKPIREITINDVERLVRKIVERRGAKSANYIRLMLASVFASMPRALGAGNPARDLAGIVEVPKGKPLGRPLPEKEIPAFLEAIDRYPGRSATKLAAKLLLLTFLRKRELIEATWDEIDLGRAAWTIPAERMKMRNPHIVPLSRQAVECFEALKVMACGSAYVFPNIGDPRRPMSRSTLNKMLDEIGYGERFTPHSARSTASTILNAQGWSADAIERQLAHTERDLVRAAYNHSDQMEARTRMMQAWANYLDGLCSGTKVTPIRKAAA